MEPDDRATRLLRDLAAGDLEVGDELLALLQGELHALARAHMAREAPDHTLQPTALVHEAWMRLVARPGEVSWENRRAFFAMASRVMRSLLVDHARRKDAGKRGGDRLRVALDPSAPLVGDAPDVDLLDLDEALSELAGAEPELARAVELRFFGGLSVPQTAEALELPLRTVERRLGVATAWLRERLGG